MTTTYVYSENYDFRLMGLDKLHPFDGRKFSRAWKTLRPEMDRDGLQVITPASPVSDATLLLGHTEPYLNTLKTSKVIARVVEIFPLRLIPHQILHSSLIQPMKYACQGTILATEAALNGGMAMNLGGGYHHAHSDHGEGFCFFSDAAISIFHHRRLGRLEEDDDIIMIDLDAHRGNGFESYFTSDHHVRIFDMYNFQVYPGLHPGRVENYPFMVPLKMGTQGSAYMTALREELPIFLDQSASVKLAFYNAGTDIVSGDPLGGLNVAYDQVVERDRYVIEQLHRRQIPVVIMTSGGYSENSFRLVAELARIVSRY